MKSIEIPFSLSVDVPSTNDGESVIADEVPMISALFRDRTHLGAALVETYGRNGGADRLLAISAGCSVGAEVDTELALHSKLGRGAELDITGLDFNPRALARAKLGRYYVPNWVALQRNFLDQVRLLESYGFDVDLTTEYPIGRILGIVKHFQVNSARVRAGHDVEFKQHDLRLPLPTPPADLITANNLLFHFHPTVATEVVRNLADGLAENGVLSVGDSDDYSMGPDHMNPELNGNHRFHPWLWQTAEMLEKDFGLGASRPGKWGQPTMFARA